MVEINPAQKEKLVSDLKVVIGDAEELLKATAGQVGADATALREKIRLRLQSAKQNLADMQHAAGERAKAAGKATDGYVHDNPWQAIGFAAGAGLLIGLLIGRR
jgi:ElaB/YqjD/DUF883 family membrane-anchored ribosome-binding protein